MIHPCLYARVTATATNTGAVYLIPFDARFARIASGLERTSADNSPIPFVEILATEVAEDLPFDIKHKIVLGYALSENDEKAGIRNVLAKRMEEKFLIIFGAWCVLDRKQTCDS